MLNGLVTSNILAAARLECDLYCASPMAQLIGDKLADADRLDDQKKSRIIGSLVEHVEFPDVRWLVNGGKIPFSSVLKLRSNSEQFRGWLRSEADRDRDAIRAYHQEVGEASGIRHTALKALKLFGVGLPIVTPLAPIDPSLQALVGGAAAMEAVAAVTGAVTAHVADKLNTTWKPVAFGNWASDYVEQQMKLRK